MALFSPAPERAKADIPTLLYVGRIAPEKSLETFLSLGADQIGPTRKVIVGDGPALAELKQRYPDVAFRGTLTGAALASAYHDADLFVFPSRTDTFGMVLIEALASGLPIAAHDVPGPRDIVTDPQLGALDEDLAEAIRRALVAPGTRAERSAYARAHYDWRAVAETFLRNDRNAQRRPDYATR
jgi:glycosyltransferase involved in cell wall biosynthesis